PEPTHLPAGLRDHPLTHRQRPETAVPQRGPQPVKERLDATSRSDDRRRGHAVYPRRPCAPVAPHPLPRNPKERRIGNEVEQVVELLVTIITSPTVQLRLNPQYPNLRA